jgi:type I restriction enzyme S subunit
MLEWIPIGDLVTYDIDRTGPSGPDDFIYVDIGSVDRDSKLIIDPKSLPVEKAPSRAKQVLKSGDVLVSMTRPNLNAVAIVPPKLDGAIGSTGFHVLRASHADPGLLFYAVQTRAFIEAMCLKVQGALYPAVRPNDISSFRLPLFPLAEQKRIVAKIEELFSELDAGEESLRRARRQLGVYRQSLLKQAFEGKLTAPWRKQNPDLLESPEQLLACIQAERQARYQQQLKAWEKAGGGRGKPKNPERIAPLADLKLALPRELPTAWTWIAVADVGRIETGTTPATKEPKNYGGNTPFFKPTDLDQGVNVREAREHLSPLGREAARILPAGTTLVTCIGATIGKTGLASVECATNQQINTISPEACFDSRFVYYVAIAPNLNGLIKSEASATTLPILNKSKFEALPFPLCSLPEQREIVRLLDEQFTVIEQNEREIAAALKRSAALRQSILKKAFTGQLVPQDPTDEPASALLERIRLERAGSTNPGRRTASKASVAPVNTVVRKSP